MRIDEIKVTPYPYNIEVKEINNKVNFNGSFSSRDGSTVVVTLATKDEKSNLSFSRDGDYGISNDGDQFKILFTVVEIIKEIIPMALDRNLIAHLLFSADSDEPSRVKLYKNKVVPLISSLLGSNWKGPQIKLDGDEYDFIWSSDEYVSLFD